MLSPLLNTLADGGRVQDRTVISAACLVLGRFYKVSRADIRENGNLIWEKFQKQLQHIQWETPDMQQTVRFLTDYTVDRQSMRRGLELVYREELDTRRCKQLLDTLLERELPPLWKEEEKTPKGLNDLAVQILGAKGGSFYDGTAGIGNTALTAWEFAGGEQSGMELCLRERSLGAAAVARLRLMLKGAGGAVHLGDALEHTGAPTERERFDWSIMFPPLGLGGEENTVVLAPDGSGKRLPSRTSQEWRLALHQLSCLKEGGRGVICMSSSALFHAASQEARRAVLDTGCLESVISLPPNLLPSIAVRLNFLVFDKSRRHEDVFMVSGEGLQTELDRRDPNYRRQEELSEQVRKELLELYRDAKEHRGRSTQVTREALKEVEVDLQPNRYIAEEVLTSERFGQVRIVEAAHRAGEWISLEQVGTLSRGLVTARGNKREGAIPVKVIRYADVKDGELQLDGIQTLPVAGTKDRYQVARGDLLISCKGPTIKLCVVPVHEGDLYLSDSFFSLRPDPAKMDVWYLKYYLESPLGIHELKMRQSGSSIVILNRKALEQMQIPYIPLPKQQQLAGRLKRAEAEIDAEIQRLKKQGAEELWRYYEETGLGGMMERIGEE